MVTAICAIAPLGYEITTATSPMASWATASVAASCTGGKQLLGAGGAVDPGRGAVVLTGIVPSVPAPPVTPSSVTTLGAEVQGGFTGPWSVRSWAICASFVPGHVVVSATGLSDSLSPKTQGPVCPADRFVHGVGFQFGGGTGEVFLNRAHVAPADPTSTSTLVTASEDQTGFTGAWAVRAFAICAA